MRTKISARRYVQVLAPGLFAAGIIFGATQVSAQEYGPNDTHETAYNGPTEQVEVSRPRLHIRTGHFDRIEKVTESHRLEMTDSELRTPWGAHALKMQVRDAARDICTDLEQQVPYPYSMQSWRSCYRDTVFNGMRNANSAIERARYERD